MEVLEAAGTLVRDFGALAKEEMQHKVSQLQNTELSFELSQRQVG